MQILKIILVLNLIYFQSQLTAQFKKGLLLDGCNNYLEVVNSSSLLMGENGITIAAWIMPNCDDGNRMIVSKEWCNGQYGYYLSVNEGRLFWSTSPDGFCTNTSNFQTSNIPIPSGVFTHVAIVHDASSIKLFVNGNLVSGQFRDGSFTTIYPSFENIRIGAYKNINGSFGNFFSGIIDELRFYNKALTAQQISESYNIPISGNESNLVLYYDMENITGSGSNLKIENKSTAFTQNYVISKGFIGNRPIIVTNADYLSDEIGLANEIEICNGIVSVELNFDNYKQINWSSGETTKSINIIKEGLYSVTVETELCRFLFDEINAIKGKNEVFQTQQLCANDSIFFNNQWIYNSGQYQQIFTRQNSCDSIITLDVVFLDTVKTFAKVSLCQGDSLKIGGQWVYNAGDYNILNSAVSGCDSLSTITIEVIPQLNKLDSVNLCRGDSIFLNDKWYFEDGIVTYLDLNTLCPINVKTTILGQPSYSYLDSISICPDDSIFYQGVHIKGTGSFIFNYKTNHGCDSVYILKTRQISPPDVPMSVPDCENGIYTLSVDFDPDWPYTWSNGSVSSPIIYTDDTTATIFYTHHDGNCRVKYDINLPTIPSDDILPFFGDTIVYPGKPLNYILDLDATLWNVDWYQNNNLSCNGCFAYTIQTQSASEIELIFYHSAGCEFYRNFSVGVNASQDLYIPNIFAPESTKGNDKWRIFIPECFAIELVKIYDRWGNLVYLTKDLQNIEWDGKYNGQNLEQGVYTYVVQYVDPGLAHKIKSGDITLVR